MCFFFFRDKEALNRINDSEFIVLLDKNSSLEAMDNQLFEVKNCLQQFKSSRTVILKGGFNEWTKTFPKFVTKFNSSVFDVRFKFYVLNWFVSIIFFFIFI